MDLLGDLRQEAGDAKAARREGVLGVERGYAQALLLAGVSASLRETGICNDEIRVGAIIDSQDEARKHI